MHAGWPAPGKRPRKPAVKTARRSAASRTRRTCWYLGRKGAERIAACWADSRKVPQIAFKPDFNRHKNAAPFKRNDQLLETLPIGVVVFPGSGISEPGRQGQGARHPTVRLPQGRRRVSAESPCPAQQWMNWPSGASCWIRSNSSRFAVSTGMPAFAAVRKISASFRHSLR